MQEADPINLIFKIQKYIKEDIENNISILVSGVDNMDTYKYITATIHTNDRILQEISNLLNPKEPNDDKVTRIRKKI